MPGHRHWRCETEDRRAISGIMRFSLPLLCLLALPPTLARAAAPAPAVEQTSDAAIVASVQNYLNGLHTLKARFLQVAPNGTLARGTAWMERPGRMRFQYDPPTPFLLVAGHGFVLFRDTKLDQTTNIPIGQTPLGILLADHINLSGGGVAATAVRRLPGEVQVTLVRTASPSEGSLTLSFATDPLALRQWTVTDAQRQRTTVTLYDVQLGGTFAPALFNPNAPMVNPQTQGGGAG